MMGRYLAICLIVACQSQAYAIEETAKVHATTILKTETSWDGKPLAYPPGQAEITGMLVEIATGGETGWHKHPVPSFGLVLEGELEVQLKSGEIKLLKAGDPIAEVVDTAHNGRNVGTSPVKLVVFYAGAAGSKLSVKVEAKPGNELDRK
jgi:quercetin dioxygenase-like cupin family protein